MSSAKTYKKATVSKGELVLDHNLNPLPNKKSAKSISLKSYLASKSYLTSTLSKSLERATGQGKRPLLYNLEPRS